MRLAAGVAIAGGLASAGCTVTPARMARLRVEHHSTLHHQAPRDPLTARRFVQAFRTPGQPALPPAGIVWHLEATATTSAERPARDTFRIRLTLLDGRSPDERAAVPVAPLPTSFVLFNGLGQRFETPPVRETGRPGDGGGLSQKTRGRQTGRWETEVEVPKQARGGYLLLVWQLQRKADALPPTVTKLRWNS